MSDRRFVREGNLDEYSKSQESTDVARFSTALRGGLSISKSDLNRMLAAEKARPAVTHLWHTRKVPSKRFR